MDREKVRELLVDKYDYKNSQVDTVLDKIAIFTEPTATAFQRWLNTGEIDDTSVEGYTVKDILARRQMKVPAAYLMLDWLTRDPAAAKAALNAGRRD